MAHPVSRDPRAAAWLNDLQIACEAHGCRKWATVELFTREGAGRTETHVARGKFCRECGRRKLRKTLREAEVFE